MAARQIAAAVLGAALCAGVASAQGRGPTPGPPLARQLAALQAEKRARTPAQRKIEARLLHADRQRRGLRVAADLPVLRTGVRAAADGSVLVDVRGAVTTRLAGEVERLGGHVVSALPGRGHLRARLPLGALEALAALPEVSRIREALPPRLGGLDASEGDAAHGADELRRTFAVSGSGVRVGVLSDGVDALASSRRRATCRRSRSCPGWPAPGARARPCSRSCTTWRRVQSSSSRPHSAASPSWRRTWPPCARLART